MKDEQKTHIRQEIAVMRAKLEILGTFQVMADKGVRQQQSAANDEVISVLKDINGQLNKLIRMVDP